MSEEKFDLVFKGELAKGVELAVAKKNIGQLFKIDAAKVDALFSGKAVVLKRGLNSDAANKYRVAIKKAGALVDMVVNRPQRPKGKATFGEVSPSQTAPVAPPVANESDRVPGAIPGTIPGTVASGADSRSKGSPAVNPAPLKSVPGEPEDSGWTLAPLGSDILKPGERSVEPEVTVDTSAMSVRQLEGNLLDDTEYLPQPEVEFSFDDFDLAEAGADVLKPEERKKVADVEVDTSSLELGSPGENLAPPKAPEPPAPDTSGISLK